MGNNKRVLLVSLILLVVFSVVLVSCGSQTPSSTPTPPQSQTPASQPEATSTPDPASAPESSGGISLTGEVGTYKAGTYEVSVRGMAGKFNMIITFSAESIVSIEVPEHHETENLGTRAIDEVIPAMIDAQSAEVDAVAGATITSDALMDGLAQALELAKP